MTSLLEPYFSSVTWYYLPHWLLQGLQQNNVPEVFCTAVHVESSQSEHCDHGGDAGGADGVGAGGGKELEGKDVRTHLSQLFLITSPYLSYFSLPPPYLLLLALLSPSPFLPLLPLLLPPSPSLPHNKPGQPALSWTQCLCNESWDGGGALSIFYSTPPLPGVWGALGVPLISHARLVVLCFSFRTGPPGTVESAAGLEPQPQWFSPEILYPFAA